MIYCFDIDGTICSTEKNYYRDSVPDEVVIKEINKLYEMGHTIKMFTARGSVSGIDWTSFTKSQLEEWGVKYHELIMNQKPHFDLLIDDKCINIEDWKSKCVSLKRGFLAGAFDLIHPGYVEMWKDAKTVCDYLIVGLQTDPTIDRPYKDKPVQSVKERLSVLSSIKYIDEVRIYETEQNLYELLKEINPDIRIIGSDHEGTQYNGHDLPIEIYWHQRAYEWSTSALKNKIRKITRTTC